MQKELEFFVEGMHCKSCEILVEETISEFDGVAFVKADSNFKKVKISGNFEEDKEVLREKISAPLEKHGYKLVKSAEKREINLMEFVYSGLFASVLAFLFIFLQKSNVINTTSSGTWGGTFLIGVVASLSSCMAVVGGLILSYFTSASKISPQENLPKITSFHISRLVSFFVLGGIIGILGSAFTLSRTTNFILSLLVGFVMFVMALNLFEIFNFSQKLTFRLPKSISQNLIKTKNLDSKVAPVLLGFSTFFLPCGFTQSMQIFALSKGSFLDGGLTMLIFALGTLPMLLLISFSSVNFSKSKYRGILFKTAGFIILFFAFFNIQNSLVAAGIINPIFSF